MASTEDKPGPKDKPGPDIDPGQAPRQGYIPRPPSPEAVERISEAQALITDEWAPAGPTPGPEAAPEPEKG